jgi:steroid delta-isomerase-like uncharacterized protein
MEDTVTTESNKELVKQFVDAFWSRGDLDAVERYMASGVIIHSPDVGNVEGLKSFNRVLRTAFPDWHSTVEELIGEGDVVAERWTGRGTHLGVFQGVPSTGNRVEVPGVVFYRIQGDAIVEFRGSFDGLRLLQQLGASPQPARP